MITDTSPLASFQSPLSASDVKLADLSSRMCNTILTAACILGLPALLASLSRISEFGLTPVMIAQSIALTTLMIVTLKRKTLSYMIRVTVLLGSIYILAVSGLWSFGHLGGGKLMLLVFIVLTALFSDTKYAYCAIALSALSLLFFGWAFVSGEVLVAAEVNDYHKSIQTWVTAILTIVLLGGFISSALSRMLEFQRTLLNSLESEASYNAALIQQAAAYLFVINEELSLLDWNINAEKIFLRKENNVGKDYLQNLLPPGPGATRLLAELMEAVEGKDVVNLETKLSDREGRHFDFIWNASPHYGAEGQVLGVICVGQDVTELKQTQSQVIQNSRLTTLGEMTTSIAHEINQPLAIIRLIATNLVKKINQCIARSELLDKEFVRAKIERIDQQVERAASVTDHMRLFGRSETGPAELFALQTVVDGALSLSAEQLRLREIELIYDRPDGDLKILGHPLDVEQVLLSVLNNAEYAVIKSGRTAGNWIRIALSREQDKILLTVADSGFGIDASSLPYLFDPFYTTKETGEGTGLGLSVAHKLLSDMGATIHAQNASDAGALFVMAFPAVD